METPSALVSLQAVLANAARVAEYCRRHGLAWRPHVKTHKSARVARLQLRAGAVGLTVATPREAEVMAGVTDDLLLAHPPVGGAKLGRLLALPDGVGLRVVLDSRVVLTDLAKAATAAGRTVGVLVEIDVGMKRVGVGPPTETVALARVASDLEGVRFDGVLFYPGHIRTPLGAQDAQLAELDALLDRHLQALADADLPPGIVSGGSTPTLFNSHRVRGLTEVRAGTCIFNDRDMVALGHCDWDGCAYVVRATVVSTAVPGQFTVDAGSKALSKEPIRSGGGGYGMVRGRPEFVVDRLSEEHGVIVCPEHSLRPEIGDVVAIVPNHVCLSVNLQDALCVENDGQIERWELEARGRDPFVRQPNAGVP